MTTLPPLPSPPAMAGRFHPFWEALRGGRLAIPRCPQCGRYVWYPADRCPLCGRLGPEWTPVAGLGTLFTFTVVHRSFVSPQPLEAPYAVGLVELAEAPNVRLVGLLGGDPDRVRIGMSLRLDFSQGDGRVPLWLPEAVPSPA